MVSGTKVLAPRSRTVAKDGPDPVDVHVGKRLRLRREMVGVTQEQLAKAIGVTFQQVQKYERGSNRVSASRLYDIARVLGVQIGFFFDDVSSDIQDARPVVVSADAPLYSDDAASRTSSLRLLRAFWRIRSEELRERVLTLTETLGRSN